MCIHVPIIYNLNQYLSIKCVFIELIEILQRSVPLDIDDCANSPCKSSTEPVCHDYVNAYSCCAPGYEGLDCSHGNTKDFTAHRVIPRAKLHDQR